MQRVANFMATPTIEKPSVVAYQELATLIEPNDRLKPAQVLRKIEHLRRLWSIDADAYQECSISFGCFRRWWQRYPLGNTVIMTEKDEIVASIGIWAIAPDQFSAFTAGQIREQELLPVTLSQCQKRPQNSWYVSGVVLAKDYRGRIKRNPLLQLLRAALGDWIGSDHVAFPLQVVALGEYEEGDNLLQRFGFSKVADRDQMPDSCHLYSLVLESEEHAESILKSRNLW